ncbi:hypothetical protein XENOCAPTIV_028272 [Xenoophorus captivus]|uniref:Dynein heavy chain 3 AAA+ lid domain-containing protein n=1 Tax=Xenoophorus captivus TaxID=1517983 RepID=A0ABV0R585_9TELE
MVPTVDTVRYNLLVQALVLNQHPVLLTGPVGTGKTSVAQNVLQGLDKKWTALTINMSAQVGIFMTSNNIQAIIESRTEKRTKGVFFPAGGKQMLCFLDDLNMPAHDLFGSQPPLELMRFWTDYGFWYDRQKQTPKYVKDMFLLASMGPPGGGRTQISARFQSTFNLINMTFPNVSPARLHMEVRSKAGVLVDFTRTDYNWGKISAAVKEKCRTDFLEKSYDFWHLCVQESQIKSIFGTMINQKLLLFNEEVKLVGETVTQATLELYNAVCAEFLPTPAKIHYLFNLRDISKVRRDTVLMGHKGIPADLVFIVANRWTSFSFLFACKYMGAWAQAQLRMDDGSV